MEKKFKCKDEIIFRFSKERQWKYSVFSHYDSDGKTIHIIGGTISTQWEILPYKDNEHLVGTTDEPEEQFGLERGDLVVVGDFLGDDTILGSIRKFLLVTKHDGIMCYMTDPNAPSVWQYCIPLSKYDINNVEATKKEILTTRNGKLIKAYD